ncbi:DUF4124 domain-containing protein [Oceanobacter mangrovi]|uniref:DUF4124 domain-containing protein n=1 Tax=Oceanobacter mangrovi TaxID=2862510 RepID=UPI001C8F0511|nr:DUF4124 domain-containing protein [Oceanobacter mangrovi]
MIKRPRLSVRRSSHRSRAAHLLRATSLLGLAFLSLVSVAATQVYVTRDADGNMIFSDRASADAEVHEVDGVPTVPAFVPPSPDRSDKPAEPVKEQSYYQSLQILSPADQTNVPPGLAADLELVVDVVPALRPDDTISVLVDGAEIGSGKKTTYPINKLVRGQHVMEAMVRDGTNKIIMRSPSVTIYIQRTSIQNPQRQNTDRRP